MLLFCSAQPHRPNSAIIPANALLFRSEGLRVGVVRNDTAELVPITIGRDYGDRVEVRSGLRATDQVILNPSDSLVSGTAVRLGNAKLKLDSNFTCRTFEASHFRDLPAAGAVLFLECGATSCPDEPPLSVRISR